MIIEMPVSAARCPVGAVALHGSLGHVVVIAVVGLKRVVCWDEIVDELPEDEDQWLRGQSRVRTEQLYGKVHVGELLQIADSNASQGDGFQWTDHQPFEPPMLSLVKD